MRRPMMLPAALSLVVLGAACQARDVHSADSANAATDSIERLRTTPANDGAAANAPVAGPVGADSLVEYHTAAMLAHVGDSLARGSTSGHVLGSHPTYQYIQVRRNQNGTPEVHDRWIDVTMVQAGHAKLLSGGRVSGSHVETTGEHRGGTISGGTTRVVGPGDLMIVPAGVPHQYLLSPGDSLRYLTVKVLRPARDD